VVGCFNFGKVIVSHFVAFLKSAVFELHLVSHRKIVTDALPLASSALFGPPRAAISRRSQHVLRESPDRVRRTRCSIPLRTSDACASAAIHSPHSSHAEASISPQALTHNVSSIPTYKGSSTRPLENSLHMLLAILQSRFKVILLLLQVLQLFDHRFRIFGLLGFHI
jgi:hypothetical protein